MKDVFIESDIPFLIAEEPIQFGHCRVALFISPGEFSILDVDFLKLAKIEGVSESHNSATVSIWTILISSPVDLVKIARDEPPHIICWLLVLHFLEECIF